MDVDSEKFRQICIVVLLLFIAIGLIVFASTLMYTFRVHGAKNKKGHTYLAEQKDWPKSVESIHDSLIKLGADTSTFEVSFMPQKEDFNKMQEAVVCRFQLDRSFWNKLIKEHDFRAVNDNEGSNWSREVYDSRWWHDFTKRARYYASRNYIEEEDGPHFLAAIETDTQMVYLIHKPGFDKPSNDGFELIKKANWPARVTDLHDSLVATSDAKMSNFEVTVALPGKWNKGGQDVLLCRTEVDYSAWRTIVNELELQSTNSSVATTWGRWLQKFRSRNDWWPKFSKDIEYYGSQNYFKGEGGSYFLTAYDLKRDKAYLIYVPQ